MNDTLSTMMNIAAEAADAVMHVYRKNFAVDYKGPNDPVTEADRTANALICSRLRAAFPGIPIVAEESPREEWQDYRDSDRVFFVDPVDGTREFVARTGHFVVMIGLLEGDLPTHGVLHAPSSGTVWAGAVGHGAIKRDGDGHQTTLRSQPRKAKTEARVVSSTSQRSAINDEVLRLLQPKEVLPIGSAGLKGAAVADGRADIYLAPESAGCLWDTCAPEALLRSIGGVFTDAKGKPINYRATVVENDDGAVAAWPGLHEEVIDLLGMLLR
jgi:3'(2'), 5'-bisphosphate nucleotidase